MSGTLKPLKLCGTNVNINNMAIKRSFFTHQNLLSLYLVLYLT